MSISKIGSKALVDCSVAAVDIADGSITTAKLAGSITNAKLANSSVTINSTSVSLGASINLNALDWQTVITADGSTGTTGVAGRGYFINTTSAAHTFTLPVSATRGDTIALKDYAGTFGTNNLTIDRNGHNIQGTASNSLINTNRASVVLVYVDTTRGWEFTTESNVAFFGPTYISATGGTITTSGNFKIHTFTGDDSFVVAALGNPAGGPNNVDYLVVAGGGGGGGAYYSGGGGAGGYRTTFPSPGCNAGSFPISATTYPITVGGGGAGGTGPVPPGRQGTDGSPSIFSTITSTGGGGGGAYSCASGYGRAGGSGGGNSGYQTSSAGSGNSPPVNPSQGNPGGVGNLGPPPGAPGYAGGGGGGASASGGNGGSPGNVCASGNGGAGSANSITASPATYAGGGGGGNRNFPVGGTGGSGGGGNGAGNPGSGAAGAQAGTSNTGGGGGATSAFACVPMSGAAGGKGIVVIRYKFQ